MKIRGMYVVAVLLAELIETIFFVVMGAGIGAISVFVLALIKGGL